MADTPPREAPKHANSPKIQYFGSLSTGIYAYGGSLTPDLPFNVIIGTPARHKAHSIYMSWCIEWIVDLIKNPPPREQFNISTSAGNIYWDSFISEIAPILWSEDPDSKQWRKLIAELICLRHYDSMNLLMKSAYQLRSKLSNAFYQLVNLVLLHATVGNRLQFQFRPDTKEFIKHYKKTMKRLSSYKRQFVRNSLDCNISTWATIILPKNWAHD